MFLHLYSAWEFSPKLEFSSESSFYYRKQLHFVVLLHIYLLTYVMDRKILFEKWRLLLRILVWIFLLFAHDLVDLKKAQSVVLHCCKMITEQVCICTVPKISESLQKNRVRMQRLDQMQRSVSGFYARPDVTVCVWFLCQTYSNKSRPCIRSSRDRLVSYAEIFFGTVCLGGLVILCVLQCVFTFHRIIC